MTVGNLYEGQLGKEYDFWAKIKWVWLLLMIHCKRASTRSHMDQWVMVLMGLRWLLRFDPLWGRELSRVLWDGSVRRVNGAVGVSHGAGWVYVRWFDERCWWVRVYCYAADGWELLIGVNALQIRHVATLNLLCLKTWRMKMNTWAYLRHTLSYTFIVYIIKFVIYLVKSLVAHPTVFSIYNIYVQVLNPHPFCCNYRIIKKEFVTIDIVNNFVAYSYTIKDTGLWLWFNTIYVYKYIHSMEICRNLDDFFQIFCVEKCYVYNTFHNNS